MIFSSFTGSWSACSPHSNKIDLQKKNADYQDCLNHCQQTCKALGLHYDSYFGHMKAITSGTLGNQQHYNEVLIMMKTMIITMMIGMMVLITMVMIMMMVMIMYNVTLTNLLMCLVVKFASKFQGICVIHNETPSCKQMTAQYIVNLFTPELKKSILPTF